LQTAPKS